MPRRDRLRVSRGREALVEAGAASPRSETKGFNGVASARQAAGNPTVDAVEARQAVQINGELRASEPHFRAMINALPAAVYTTDEQGRLTYFNQAAAAISGRTPQVGTGRWSVSWKLYRVDGTPLPYDEFPMARALITEHEQAEKQLQESVAKVADSDRRKTEFLAMLAHELRNPLAPISHGLEVIRLNGGNGQALRPVIELVERQVRHLVGLVDDLLDVSRINWGKIALRRRRVELRGIVNDAVEIARPFSERMHQDLTVIMPPEPIYLNADQLRLTQVVGNLLNNACKFTEEGGCIRLSVERKDDQAVIRVRDNGAGIAGDNLPRIFDMFMQADVSIERPVSGLGIGLALVKSLVEMHGGTVEVHSAGMGHGSEFVVRLPITAEARLPHPAETAVEDASALTGRRILVVDDNRDAAESLAMLLKLGGNETHTTYDGLEAVEVASRIRPDVILLDIGLPKISGYEVARRIREQPWGKSVLVVALTGWGQDADREKSRNCGFDGHLVKPADIKTLAKLLSELSWVGRGS